MKELKKGNKGIEVKILQLFLNINADGIFGSKTENAVKNFQRAVGHDQTGIVSQNDWNTIANMMPTIKYGYKGNEVKIWQLILGIDADGEFGPNTRAVTRTYQASAGLEVDGVVGPKTWAYAFGVTHIVPSETVIAQPVNYKQYDSKWGSVVYTKNNTYNKSQTIRSSGCGPTAMADIVATWWDSSVTPVAMAALSVANGYRTTNSGTAWGFFKFVAQKYKASKFIQTSNYSTASNAIENGALVICSMGPGLYTTGGHFILWWKTDGTYNYVNDPASASSNRARSKVNIIRSQAKQFFIFYH